METRTELKGVAKASRFQITKLEERIAPATNNVNNIFGSFNNNALNFQWFRNVLVVGGLGG